VPSGKRTKAAARPSHFAPFLPCGARHKRPIHYLANSFLDNGKPAAREYQLRPRRCVAGTQSQGSLTETAQLPKEMMLVRTLHHALTGLAAGCILLSLWVGAASAGTAANHSVEVRRSSSVLWLETSLPRTTAHTVKFSVFAPTGPDGRRELWQYCSVDYVGFGTYRCGVDFSRKSAARRIEGNWGARLHIDGKLVDRKIFEVRRAE
jgi:hypothetical protein